MTASEKKMKTLVLITGFGFYFLFGHFFLCFAAESIDTARRGVVKIVAYKPGNMIETGAGIVSSIKKKKIFIVTAFHVIEEADSIIVKFYEYPAERFIGEPFEKYDEVNDVAVIYLKVSEKLKKISKLRIGDAAKINELDKVIALGHPSDSEWELSSAEIRSSESYQFRFSGDAVDPGNSGGALLNESCKLIGLITKKRPRDGIALKVGDALEILKSWRIPCELNRGKKKWPWIVAGGTAAGIAAIVFIKPPKNGNGEDGEGGFPEPPGRPK